MALLSNAQSCYTRAELEMTGLASVLDDVIISSEEKIRKPARDLYMLALDREFVTAKHALMVGNDEKNDIVGARSAGIEACISARRFRRPTIRMRRVMRCVRLRVPIMKDCWITC